MEIWNCKNPEIYPYVAPWMISIENSIVEMCVELKDRLTNSPDDTLCLLAIEDKVCHAVAISYKVDDCIWIWQARSKSGFRHSDFMFDLIKKWAVMKNAKELRIKTTDRLARFFRRRYKFHSLSNGELKYEFRTN